MPFDVRALPQEPIIIITLISPFDSSEDSPRLREAVDHAMQQAGDDVVFIYDVTQFRLTFSEMVQGLYWVSRGERGTVSDPNAKTVVVGSSSLIRVAANAMQQAQYGRLNIPLVATLEEGLATARAEVAARGKA